MIMISVLNEVKPADQIILEVEQLLMTVWDKYKITPKVDLKVMAARMKYIT